MDNACTNPAALGGGKALFKGAYLPLHVNNPAFDVQPSPNPAIQTPFALYRDFYSGECVKDGQNHSYLEISVTPGAGDQRENAVPFAHPLFTPSFLGTHVIDYNFAIDDLIDLVAEKGAAESASD
jgi:hypothetical protein